MTAKPMTGQRNWFESTDITFGGMHYLHRAGPWAYPWAHHTHLWEMWMTTHGMTSFRLGRRTLAVPVGHCLCLAPGRDHQQIVAEREVSLGLTVHFLITSQGGPLRRLVGKVMEIPPLGRTLLRQLIDNPPEDEQAKARWRGIWAMILNDLLAPGISEGSSEASSVSRATSRRDWTQDLPMVMDGAGQWSLAHHVLEFLKDHLHRPMDCMNRLSRHLGYSQAHLNMLFRQETGITLLEALQRLRLAEAIRLLRATNLKISAIALQLGFRHPHKFNAFFQSRMRCTPTQFIRNRRAPGWTLSSSVRHPLVDEVFRKK